VGEDALFLVRIAPEDEKPGWRGDAQVIHPTEGSAWIEAERLSRSTGKRFLVFRSIGYVRPVSPPVEQRRGSTPAGDELAALPF